MGDYETVHCTGLVFHCEMNSQCLNGNTNDIQGIKSFPYNIYSRIIKPTVLVYHIRCATAL